MPHKRSPIAAVTTRGAAGRAAGLVVVLFAAMDGEHQRAAGAWHAEWQTLTDLLRATGGAAARLRVSVAGLRVDPDRMAENLPASGAIPVDLEIGADPGRWFSCAAAVSCYTRTHVR